MAEHNEFESDVERSLRRDREDPIGAAIRNALTGLMAEVEMAGAIIIAVDKEGQQYALKVLGDDMDEEDKDATRDMLDAATKGVDAHLKARG